MKTGLNLPEPPAKTLLRNPSQPLDSQILSGLSPMSYGTEITQSGSGGTTRTQGASTGSGGTQGKWVTSAGSAGTMGTRVTSSGSGVTSSSIANSLPYSDSEAQLSVTNQAFDFPMVETSSKTQQSSPAASKSIILLMSNSLCLAVTVIPVMASPVIQNDMLISLAELSGKLINSRPRTVDNIGSSKITTDICVTADCIRAATQIKASQDLTASPCEDFYQYTCGRWLSNSQIRPDQSSMSLKWELQEQIDYKLHQLLNQTAQAQHTLAEEKAIIFYKSCLNEGTIETLGLDVIKPLFEDIGGWPILDRNWTDRQYKLETMLSAARKYTIDTPMFSMSVESDPIFPENHVIHLEQPHLSMPDRNLYLTNNNVYAGYVTYMLKVFKALSPNPSTIVNDVKDVVVFETQLAKLTQEMDQHPDPNTDKRMTVDQLMETFPGLDWKQYIYNIFNMDQVGIPIHSSDIVVVSNPEFFRNLIGLLRNTSAR
ncbi:neprilysin-1-like [Pecten maximus]|uniref:neprilysin-1-like n=1 Tax=Pecten maximus TaxID=6579 RepID=UPI001457F4E7|nr:neprilysin-1-like [Pecten maximus]